MVKVPPCTEAPLNQSRGLPRAQAVELRQDTGVTLATRDNMHEPDVASLLAPNLARYLDR